jgi:hypothetical protein
LPRCRDLGAVLRFLVEGDAESPPYEHFFTPYQGWKDAEGVTVVRFDDIIGSRGGGKTGVQLAVLSSLAERIGWQGDPQRLLSAIGQTFNPRAGTFRRGTLDGWQHDLRDLHGTAHLNQMHRLARRWGYRDDLALASQAAVIEPVRIALPDVPVAVAQAPPSNTTTRVGSGVTAVQTAVPAASRRATPRRTDGRPAVLRWLQKLGVA